jgi:putative hemolysin
MPNRPRPSHNDSHLEGLYKGLPCGKLFVKLAQTPTEKEKIFKLRYKIFNEELEEGLAENKTTGLDRDRFDDFCDHLMVLNESHTVIGTYRLLPGPKRPAEGFYTETEFNIKNLPLDMNHTVELGRGCIQKEFRKQTTLMTLFWGLHRYMLGLNAKFMLGCGSLPKMTAHDAEATYLEIEKRNLCRNEWHAHPHPTHLIRGEARLGTSQIPQLIEFYFQFGAKVLGRPAFDKDFGCFDLLLVFDMEHLTPWGAELLERFDKRLTKANS